MCDTRRFAAARADNLDLAGIDSALSLDNAGLVAHLASLDMLADHVAALNDDFAFLRAHGHDLALLAAVPAADNDDGVTRFYMNFVIHQ